MGDQRCKSVPINTTVMPSPIGFGQRPRIRSALRGIQAKLSISQPHDPLEHEADRVADAVLATRDTVAPQAALPAISASSPSAAATLQRTPGVDAEDSWSALVTQVVRPRNDGREERAREAVRRYLMTVTGQRLINQLWTLFCSRGRGACRSRVTASFLDQRSGGWEQAGGYFGPDEPNAAEYRVDVRNLSPPDPDSRSRTLWGEWGTGPEQVSWTHVDPESDMANALFHELLHVWFVNTQTDLQGAMPPDLLHTGHGDPYRGEIDPLFSRRYQAFATEMSSLETRLHTEAREAMRRQEERRRQEAVPSGAAPQPSAPRGEAGSRPSPWGGGVSLLGGVGGTASLGARGSVILGADLILSTLVDLRLGARGVYLTPGHLMAGGAAGVRWLQGEGEQGRVTNPIFFDVEAGVLAELTPTDVARITDHVAGFGAVGIGQEFGRQGPRMFWQVGGFVIVTDRLDVIGGGMAGGGVRF
jgi:hypothetical protein